MSSPTLETAVNEMLLTQIYIPIAIGFCLGLLVGILIVTHYANKYYINSLKEQYLDYAIDKIKRVNHE